MPQEDYKINGRPTDYKEEYDEQAYNYCLLGATDKQLCTLFHIDMLTLASWARNSESFFNAITPSPEDVEIFNRKGEEKRLKRREWKRGYIKASASRRIERATRARVHAATAGKTASISGMPFTVSELKQHLESLFVGGMSWDNYGKWHIDHIKPCSLFDQSDEGQLKDCWSLSNLQPLWAEDNIKKGNKYASS
ncbi:hypothetical protein [Leclercia sp.]|uniref:hypothetical protein n=1 Tax=Leclercia sp. TaxID=1898428 RepID=UPI0028AA7A83|nr:hypothetical protein [Leclercia sp.]